MPTSIDSNVIIGLWDVRHNVSALSRRVLDDLRIRDKMLVCACVHAELVAGPGRTAHEIDAMLADTRIDVDWQIGESIWRLAGERFAAYAARRRESRSGEPHRILADFVIGAHAEVNGYALLTLDRRLYRRAFPKLNLKIS